MEKKLAKTSNKMEESIVAIAISKLWYYSDDNKYQAHLAFNISKIEITKTYTAQEDKVTIT